MNRRFLNILKLLNFTGYLKLKVLLSAVFFSLNFFSIANAFTLPWDAPRQLRAEVEEFEKISDKTKALAYAAESKFFGQKQFVWGKFKGDVSQDNADSIALSICNKKLEEQKTVIVDSKKLYDFGNGKCELFTFINKSISTNIKESVNITEIPSTSSLSDDHKPQYLLKSGWVKQELTERLKELGFHFVAINKSIDAGLRYRAYPKSEITSPKDFAQTMKFQMASALKSGANSDTEEIQVNNQPAYTFQTSGNAVSNNLALSFKTTVFQTDKAVIVFDVWTRKERFEELRPNLLGLSNGFTFNDRNQVASQEPNNLDTEGNLKNNKESLVSTEGGLNRVQPSNSQSIVKIEPNTTSIRRALVIGNDSYKSVAKLSNAREDARTIASNLTAVGYQVTLRLDLTEKEMKAALRTFAGQVQGGDEVLFFFAGHGVQLGAANYLLPTDIVGDSEAQVRDEAIQLQRVLDDMSEKKAKFTLAMIDACRDNPFKSTGRALGGRGLAPTTAATGQMVIFSAGTGQQALDKLSASDKNKNGLFTRVFVQEMQKPNQSVDRVMKSVRNQVAELAKSVGHEQVPAIYDQVLGDFYFKP
jgi:hypothetical protein